MTDQALWLNVIHLAVEDAQGDPERYRPGSHREKVRQYRDAARSWLFSNRTDFPFVCRLAGLEPEVVRRRAQALIQPTSEAT